MVAESIPKSFKLKPTGDEIPSIGLGTWKATKPGEVQAAVEAAYAAGYRHFDCAHIYGNEAEVGKAFARIGRDKMRDVFVTSKLWNDSWGRVEDACRTTLKNLQLDHLSLYLIHWPLPFVPGTNDLDKDQSVEKVWGEMEKLVEKGLVRNIGVSNFTEALIERVLKVAKIRPACNQVEMHPFLTQPELRAACKKHDIQMTAYSSLGTGGSPSLLSNETVVAIAKKHNKTPAQVLISWPLMHGVCTIPKSSNPERIKQNLGAFVIPKEDLDALDKLNTGHRFINPKKLWGFAPWD